MNNLMKCIGLMALTIALVGCGRGPAGPAGSKGDTGSIGASGSSGSNGADGLNGSDGQDGAQGPAGADGTIVTIVPLCPGVANYGAFVEQALCINGKLYGVYSANNGFLAYLADGAYSSNVIGSACNLHVTGCTVTH